MIKKLSISALKNFILPGVFAFAGFLIFLPDLCFASVDSVDIVDSRFFVSIPVILYIFLFFAIWIIESNVIKAELKENPRRSLGISFIINFVTISLWYFLIRFDVPNYFHFFDYEFFIFPVFLFAIELTILFFYCRKARFGSLFKTVFIMNLASCSFALFFTFFDIVSTVLIIFIFFVSMCYFAFCFLKSLNNDEKNLEKNLEKKQKIIAILVGVFSVIFLMFFYFVAVKLEYVDTMPGIRSKLIEERAQSDIRQIGTACELYYTDVDKYPVYKDFVSLKQGGIGNYMKVNDLGSSVPDDPRGGDVHHYVWIDNTGEGEDQHFCVYAKLKESKKENWYSRTYFWFVSSEKGTKNVTREPTGLGDACW